MFSLTQVITLKEAKLAFSYLLRKAPRFKTFYNENNFPVISWIEFAYQRLFKIVQIK